MLNRWKDSEAQQTLDRYAPKWGADLAIRIYTSRLLGTDPQLVLHGGGNTSVKSTAPNIVGENLTIMYVKATGHNLGTIEPEGLPGVDLLQLQKLRALASLGDEAMVNQYRLCLLDSRSPTPSVEALVHALIPNKFVDHTHANAILAMTNQSDGEALLAEALGRDVCTLDYVNPGFDLAKATAHCYEKNPSRRGMVWARHGIVTWGETAKESYEAMIDLVKRAEDFLARKARHGLTISVPADVTAAQTRLLQVAPVVRGLLAPETGNADRPRQPMIVRPLINAEVLEFVGAAEGKALALTPVLTADHLIRTKAFPAWVDDPAYDDAEKLRAQLTKSFGEYAMAYESALARHEASLPEGTAKSDPLPRVVCLPGLGALCVGEDVKAADIARDIAEQTFAAKRQIAAMGKYQGLPEDVLVHMEYRTVQQSKLRKFTERLRGHTALVTGAAGAIGSAIAEGLLLNGCHVAVTDLPSPALEGLAQEFKVAFGERTLAVPLDVTDAQSVARGFEAVIRAWGGLDLLIINAGLALAAPLEKLTMEGFRRLERVNVEGTLLLLKAAGSHFKLQNLGGDIILVSTKNVFSPGAQFGAYSATKAGAHQLCRIASLELAPMGVRVNMVAPDAVFSHGKRRSGLWAEVGPERMKARGLDEAGLEEHYRNRNLLKARVTAHHVANAVMYFATRQTPTTGATIPVDGGLPDATPR
jgi:rhamnose utilization protein RhaD (predicted bifunctional aldolase and dehydrogenase)/NAD(P)-dependent dehydrogenase (short-subunit alcohol dehydrogenase family)